MNTYKVSFTATYWVDASSESEAEHAVYEAMLCNNPNPILDSCEVDNRTVNVYCLGQYKELA